MWTILSQTPRRTPQVTSDAGWISARIFWLFPKERRMLRKRDYQGRLSFHFFDRWMTDLATHRQKKVQAMSWKNLQMLEFCLFTWSWMGPINCAPNPFLLTAEERMGNQYWSQCRQLIACANVDWFSIFLWEQDRSPTKQFTYINHLDREERELVALLNSSPGVSWWLSSSSSRCHGTVCGLWLWYFLIILTYYF